MRLLLYLLMSWEGVISSKSDQRQKEKEKKVNYFGSNSTLNITLSGVLMMIKTWVKKEKQTGV